MEPVATELGVSSPSEIVRAPSRGGTGDRVAWFILGIIPLAVIALAATLSPDPSGHGTHQQLGLPPCGFIYVTGYPCPGCGLTTAFAHMVRLEFVGAARANDVRSSLHVLEAAHATQRGDVVDGDGAAA